MVTNINEHGGISRTVDFIRACEAFNVVFRFHSGETGIASVRLPASVGRDRHVREASQTIVRWYADDVSRADRSHKKGIMAVPTRPGLGVSLDPKALRRCHERFLQEGSFPAGSKAEHYGGAFRKR